MAADGSCDTANVDEAVVRLPTKRIVVRSTVPPGTIDDMVNRTRKAVCHFPEFYGEGAHTGLPRPQVLAETDFCMIGGSPDPRDEVVGILAPLYGAAPSMASVHCGRV